MHTLIGSDGPSAVDQIDAQIRGNDADHLPRAGADRDVLPLPAGNAGHDIAVVLPVAD